MNKNRSILRVLICFCLLSLSFIGSGEALSSEMVTVVDVTGQSVDVPYPVERVVVIPSSLARLVYALGVEDKIVGVGQNCKFPSELEDKPDMGKWSTPNLELLLEQDPDLVIADGHLKITDQIEDADLPVVILSTASTSNFLYTLETLGLIFDREDRAGELADLVCEYRDLIEDHTGDLEEEEKTQVFYEWSKPYFSYSALASGHQNLVAAGGTNIAAEEPVKFPLVSAEWLVEKNPQVIIRSLYFGGERSPPDAEERLCEMRNEIMDRPGLSEVDAVKDDRVYVFNSGLTSDFGSVVAIAYYAKWLHPDLFEDVDAEAVHSDLVQEFYDTELGGTWVYPG